MFITKVLTLVLTISSALSQQGCDGDQEAKANPEQTIEVATEEMPEHPVKGAIIGQPFEPEKIIFRDGNLLFRQGRDFFADLSVELVFFGDTEFEGKTVSSKKLAQSSMPHVRVENKKKGESLPDSRTFMDGFVFLIKFGKSNELGIPLKIKFSHKASDTNFEGTGVATYRDIKIKNGELDLTDDSWDTLDIISRQYIGNLNVKHSIDNHFGMTITNYHADFPKTGFIGYEATTGGGNKNLIKLQLKKSSTGWGVVNQLLSNQIHQAHPVEISSDLSERSVEGRRAAAAAAKQLEKFLNQGEIISSVRTTSINCYLTKTNNKASCKGVYGLKQEGELICKNQNYLVIRSENVWNVDREIDYGQSVDYKSGELIEKKPFRMHCS